VAPVSGRYLGAGAAQNGPDKSRIEDRTLCADAVSSMSSGIVSSPGRRGKSA
jgi:hypothetical protein